MEKIFLLGELLYVIDIRHLINSVVFKLSKFEKGRIYQLVIDRSKNIVIKEGRIYNCDDYMNTKNKIDMMGEAYTIIDNFRKGRKYKNGKKYNQWHQLHLFSNDNFYYGRCIQFILDTNNNKDMNELLNKYISVIITEAHLLKTELLRPKIGDIFSVRGCDCNEWSYGDRRCSCGNRRCYLEYKNVINLDDTELYSYVECY
jgi:hypothetical protein